MATRSCSRHWSTLATTRQRLPLRYSIQADVSTITISISSHFVQVALPTDFALELAKLFLAVDLNEQPQSGLYCRPLCSAAAGAQRPRHQLVIYYNIRSHDTPLSCVFIIHIEPALVKSQQLIHSHGRWRGVLFGTSWHKGLPITCLLSTYYISTISRSVALSGSSLRSMRSFAVNPLAVKGGRTILSS